MSFNFIHSFQVFDVLNHKIIFVSLVWLQKKNVPQQKTNLRAETVSKEEIEILKKQKAARAKDNFRTGKHLNSFKTSK